MSLSLFARLFIFSLFDWFIRAVARWLVCVSFVWFLCFVRVFHSVSWAFRDCSDVRRIELASSSRDSLRGRSARVSFFVNALRVSRAVTRLTVYRPHRVLRQGKRRRDTPLTLEEFQGGFSRISQNPQKDFRRASKPTSTHLQARYMQKLSSISSFWIPLFFGRRD